MSVVFQQFLLPASPVLALIGGGSLLIALECLPQGSLRTIKSLVAMASALGAAICSVYLLKNGLNSPLPPSTAPAWLAEFARFYRLDSFSLSFYLAIALFTLLSLLLLKAQFSLSDIRTEVLALTLFIASGMMVLASADSLLMTFLGLEMLSLPTYVLVGTRRKDKHSTEAALKYFLFGSFATALFVLAIALIYATFGTLNLSRIASLSTASPPVDQRLMVAAVGLLVASIGFKVGLAPFHLWVPDAYQGAPASVTAFMGSAVKLAGFALALRVFWNGFSAYASTWQGWLALFAVAAMFAGNLAALVQDDLKRLFAYSSVSHAGFLTLGILSGATTGAASLYYYLVVYGLSFLGIFTVLVVMERAGVGTEIYSLGGLGFSRPGVGLCIALFSLSAAGLPPTAGFLAKYFVFLDTIRTGHTELVVWALVASLIGVYYYLRVLVYLYMKEGNERLTLQLRQQPWLVACLAFCALAMVALTLFPRWLTEWVR